LATAARPSEALKVRLCEIDRSADVWVYKPGSHKTQHHGKSRIILIGPRGQAIVQEHVTSTDPEAYVFGVRPGKAYRRDSYTNAIKRACELAFGMPKELRKLKADAPAELNAKAESWRAEHCWSPNQLRHTAATAIRRAAGIEEAKTILGHSELRTTEIYAERELVKAAEIIQKIG
jgi:integrase